MHGIRFSKIERRKTKPKEKISKDMEPSQPTTNSKNLGKYRILFYSVFLVVVLAVLASVFFLRPVIYQYQLMVPIEEGEASVLQYGSNVSLSDLNFFNEVRQSFVDQEASFISVDLSEMVLSVYLNGEQELEVSVAAKGREGSWWETPAGIYQIGSKARNHVTSFGGLHMPWSMQFHGNFFIHGWPYFPDGTPVAGDTSGGCVRLTNENAQLVFSMVEVGMPVLVHERRTTERTENLTYLENSPDLQATHFLAVDLESNHALVRESYDQQAPLSVLTHLLNALTVVEHINIENNVDVLAGSSYDVSGISSGSSYRVYDLLFPLLQSGSDTVAGAFAEYRGESNLINMMQSQAGSIGMQNTDLFSPRSDSSNLSSPEDLFVLAKYLYNYRSFILDVASGRVSTHIYGEPRTRNTNENHFLSNNEFRGGLVLKPDSTKESTAGMAVFSMEFGDITRPVVFIVMGSPSPAEDIEEMYRFVKSNYSVRELDSFEMAEEDETERSVLDIDLENQRASILESVYSLQR